MRGIYENRSYFKWQAEPSLQFAGYAAATIGSVPANGIDAKIKYVIWPVVLDVLNQYFMLYVDISFRLLLQVSGKR